MTTVRRSTIPAVDAVVVAMPPRFHLEWTLAALDAGKHVLVEKPAFVRMEDYERVCAARDRAGRTVIVGENDHYKPLAVCLRRLLADGANRRPADGAFHHPGAPPEVGRRLAQTTRARRAGTPSSRRASTGCTSRTAWGRASRRRGAIRPPGGRDGPDRRAKSLLAAFRYDTGAGGTLYYSREVPSLLRGLRLSKLFGRDGIISFESNGAAVLVRGPPDAPPGADISRLPRHPRLPRHVP